MLAHTLEVAQIAARPVIPCRISRSRTRPRKWTCVPTRSKWFKARAGLLEAISCNQQLNEVQFLQLLMATADEQILIEGSKIFLIMARDFANISNITSFPSLILHTHLAWSEDGTLFSLFEIPMTLTPYPFMSLRSNIRIRRRESRNRRLLSRPRLRKPQIIHERTPILIDVHVAHILP